MGQEDSISSKQQDLPEASTNNTNSNNTSEKKGLSSKFPLDGKIPVGGIGEVEKETPIRLVVGGILQNNVDSEPPKLPVRVPARIERQGRNSFTFHIEDSGGTPAGAAPTKESTPSWKVATIATQASADLMPDDVAKVLWNVEKVPVKVSIWSILGLLLSCYFGCQVQCGIWLLCKELGAWCFAHLLLNE